MGIAKTIAIIFLVIILLIFARGCISGCGQQSYNYQPKVPEKTIYDCLNIENYDGEYDNGYLTVTGKVKNSCSENTKFVQVCVTVYDSTGKTAIGNDFTYASGPNSGVSGYGQSTFKSMTLLDIEPEEIKYSVKICDGRFG